MNADVQNRTGTTLVRAAQAGDRQAQEALVAAWLPLVYNVAGRALDGHADVDDVAQETMIRALDGLDGLREPESFRSWLVAITMNQIRRRHAAGQQQPTVGGLDETWELADPRADFTDLTVLRLGLSGQRREVAEATRWLDPDDRELLALWWLEASGELTRTELAEALDLTPQHTAVRVQRMKKQLEAGRIVVRALGAYPRCPELADVTTGFDGTPNSVWRKRIARHIRGCATCDRLGRDLFPAEGLLAGLALVPIPLGSPALLHFQHTAATVATTAPTAASTHAGWAGTAARKAVLASGAVAVVTVTTLALVWSHPADTPRRRPPNPPPRPPLRRPRCPPRPRPPPRSPCRPRPRRPPARHRRPRRHPPPPGRWPRRRPARSANSSTSSTPNAARWAAPPADRPRLHAAAQKHADDMVARGFFDHVNPDGVRTDARLTAVGYRWSQWGENLDRGPTSPATVVAHWMDGGIHQTNMLDCGFKDVGVGLATGPAGAYWTQDLGAPLS